MVMDAVRFEREKLPHAVFDGQRFEAVAKALDERGVAYHKNYGGKFEQTFPHHAYLINFQMDRNHCSVYMHDGIGDPDPTEIAFIDSLGNLAVDMLNLMEAALLYVEKMPEPSED